MAEGRLSSLAGWLGWWLPIATALIRAASLAGAKTALFTVTTTGRLVLGIALLIAIVLWLTTKQCGRQADVAVRFAWCRLLLRLVLGLRI